MKIYFIYEGDSEAAAGKAPLQSGARLNRTKDRIGVKLTPEQCQGTCGALLTVFCGLYNKKHGGGEGGEKCLQAADLNAKVGSVLLKPGDVVSAKINDYNDVLILHKEASEGAGGKSSSSSALQPGYLRCGHFGCGHAFKPEDNSDTSCHYHAQGPVFHDTAKYWACCPHHKAYDFDDFEKVPPCQVGRHEVRESTNQTFKDPSQGAGAPATKIDNVPLTAQQVAALDASASSGASAAASGPRRTGPREFEGAVAGKEDTPGPVVDGVGTCRNFGCGNKFRVDENNDTACTFHKGGPVFWDTYKYWSCCPDKKRYEFEEFAKVPGCCTGPHKL